MVVPLPAASSSPLAVPVCVPPVLTFQHVACTLSQVSEAFARLLPLEDWLDTGGVEVKGKGLMQTYLWMPKPEDLVPMGVGPRPALPRDGSMESLDEVRAPAPSTMSSALTTAPDDSAADRTEVDGTMRSSAASPSRPKSSRPYSSRHRPKSSRFARPTTARLRQSREGELSRPSTASSHGGLSRAPSMGRGTMGRSLPRRNVSFRFHGGDEDSDGGEGNSSTPLMAILNAIRGSNNGEDLDGVQGGGSVASSVTRRERPLQIGSEHADSDDDAPLKVERNQQQPFMGVVPGGPRRPSLGTLGVPQGNQVDAFEGGLYELRPGSGAVTTPRSGEASAKPAKAVRLSLAPEQLTESRNSPNGAPGGRVSLSGVARGSNTGAGVLRVSNAGGASGRPSATGGPQGPGESPGRQFNTGGPAGAVPRMSNNGGGPVPQVSGSGPARAPNAGGPGPGAGRISNGGARPSLTGGR